MNVKTNNNTEKVKKTARTKKKAAERVADVTEQPALKQFLDGFQRDVNLSKYYNEHPLKPVKDEEKPLTYEEAVVKASKIGNLFMFVQSVCGVLPGYINELNELGKTKKQYDKRMLKCFQDVKVLQQKIGSLLLTIGDINSDMNGLVKDIAQHKESVKVNTEIARDMLAISLDCQENGLAMPHKDVLIRMPLTLLNSLSIVDDVWRMNEVKIYGLPEVEEKKPKKTKKSKSTKKQSKKNE